MSNTQLTSKKLIPNLSTDQMKALSLLLTGESDISVAEQVGVQRETITRWRLNNIVFKAELNRQRGELWEANVDQMRGLLPIAIKTLKEALLEGDIKERGKMAFEILRTFAFSQGDGKTLAPKGSSDLKEVLMNEVLHVRKMKQNLKLVNISTEELEEFIKMMGE